MDSPVRCRTLPSVQAILHASVSMLVGLAAVQVDPPDVRLPAVPVPVEIRQRPPVGPDLGNAQQLLQQATQGGQGPAVPSLPSEESLRERTIGEPAATLIAQLASTVYAERRSASERLQSTEVPIEDLLAALAKSEPSPELSSKVGPALSPEQHHRLLAIAFDRIVNAPRGALGIQMNPARAGDGGVRITRVIPGFPAEKHLQVDDLVVAIDGRAVRDVSDLRMIVQGQPPGTAVRVEAIRAERDERGKPKLDETGAPVTKRIDVRVPLGSKRELDNAEPANAGFGIDPLDTARQEVGRALLRRFPPKLVNVRLPDDAKVEADFAARDVEQHEYVDRLRRELLDARNQQRPVAAHTLGWFRAQMRTMRTMSEDSMLSDAERGWHARVARRLEEMLESAGRLEGDGGDEP